MGIELATGTTDVAVVGGGPGGYKAALRLAELGKKVTVIESEKVGGVCLHHGCVPAKALIHVAETYKSILEATKFGIDCSNLTINFTRAQEWKKKVVDSIETSLRNYMISKYIMIIKGTATFENSTKLSINGTSQGEINALEFKKCIIATGSHERLLPNINIDGKVVITSKHALEFDHLPSSVLVIGGGYIGVELSQFLAKFGVKVTIIEMSTHILELLDIDISERITEELKAQRVDIYCETKVESVELQENSAITTIVLPDHTKKQISTEKILLAIGRVPDTAPLQLHNTLVELDSHGFIKVDNHMQTTDPSILAIGDVVGGVMLAHKAEFEGRIAAEVICGKNSTFDNFVPYGIFSDPEVGGVGITEKDAKRQGISCKVKKYNLDVLAKAKILGSRKGFMKVLFNDEKRILGVHIVGPRATDLAGEAVLAMEMGATLDDLALTIHAHPTLAEAFLEMAEQFLDSK